MPQFTAADAALEAQKFQKIMSDCEQDMGNAGGIASQVRRLKIRQSAEGGAGTRSVGRTQANYEDDSLFLFYIRHSPISRIGEVALNLLYRNVAAAVCTSVAYAQDARTQTMIGTRGEAPGSSLPRLHVPRIHCCIDQTYPAYWNQAEQAVRHKIDWTAAYNTMMIVQGADSHSLEHYEIVNFNWSGFNFQGNACALGVIHALDIIVGNGDRFEKPNTGNMFFDKHGGVIAIDCDACLPKRGTVPDETWNNFVLRGTPNVTAEFDPYTQNPRGKLSNVFDHAINVISAMDNTSARTYAQRLGQYKERFVRCALLTFRVLKTMQTDLPSWFPDDPTCSVQSLLAKIRALPAV